MGCNIDWERVVENEETLPARGLGGDVVMWCILRVWRRWSGC